MLKKVINYTGFDDKPHSGTYYFNMTRTDTLNLLQDEQFVKDSTYLTDVIGKDPNSVMTNDDVLVMLRVFKAIIYKSFGVRSTDGESFTKVAPDGHLYAQDFEQTAAYDELFMSFVNDPAQFNDFLTGVIPSELRDQVTKAEKTVTGVADDSANEAQAPGINPVVSQITPEGGVANAGLKLV